MKYLLIWLIRLYQKTFSLDHGPFRYLRPGGQCKFHPTCSMYAIEAIEKYGSINGGLKALGRIRRCHPWATGGIDEVK